MTVLSCYEMLPAKKLRQSENRTTNFIFQWEIIFDFSERKSKCFCSLDNGFRIFLFDWQQKQLSIESTTLTMVVPPNIFHHQMRSKEWLGWITNLILDKEVLTAWNLYLNQGRDKAEALNISKALRHSLHVDIPNQDYIM